MDNKISFFDSLFKFIDGIIHNNSVKTSDKELATYTNDHLYVNSKFYNGFKAEYPKQIYDEELSFNEILRKEKDDLYFYCDLDMISQIIKYTDFYALTKNNEEEYECCVCLEDKKQIDMVISPCPHSLCISCFDLINKKTCPICRKELVRHCYKEKYCIIFLGEPTQKYTFENGGYLSIRLVYIPSFKDVKTEIFRGLTYKDNNENKQTFISTIFKLADLGYSFIASNKQKVKEWSNGLMISDIMDQLDMIEL